MLYNAQTTAGRNLNTYLKKGVFRKLPTSAFQVRSKQSIKTITKTFPQRTDTNKQNMQTKTNKNT